MIPLELLADYRIFCGGLKKHLEAVRKGGTQAAVDRGYVRISDQVMHMIAAAVDQRKFCKVVVTTETKKNE